MVGPSPDLFLCDRPFLYFIGSFAAANEFDYEYYAQDVANFIVFAGTFHG